MTKWMPSSVLPGNRLKPRRQVTVEPIEYDRMAELEESYWWYLGLRAMVSRTLQSELRGKGRLTILDAGCGTGGGMASLSRAFPGSFLVGSDVAASAIRYTSQRHVGRLAFGSANCLPFKDGSFDAVLSIDVLYMEGVDDHTAIREAYRVLRPGGVLVVNVPALECLRGAHDLAVHARHRYRRDEVHQLLTSHGFWVHRLMYWNFFLLPLVFVVRRFLCPAAPDLMPRSDLRPLPGALNWLLTRLIVFDTWVCSAAKAPAGSSIFGVAFKPQD
jgi:SAM-dependent methyltransferase